MPNRTCPNCFCPLSKFDHGNRQRCHECSLLEKRQSNRNRQRIIRQVGNQGLKNLKILDTMTSTHDWEAPFITTIRKLTNLGFDFSKGGSTFNTYDELYPRVFVVIQFEVFHHPNGEIQNFQSVLIKQNNKE
jgi:hypothetical protein